MAHYVTYHGQLGAGNTYMGIPVDYGYQIHQQCVLGYVMGHTLGPTGCGRGPFHCHLTMLLAQPRQYQEAVTAYMVAHPEQPFISQAATTSVCIRRLAIDDAMVEEISMDNVVHTLIFNHIPVKWVAHAYPYGICWINQQYAAQTPLWG
ncbi:hypothetical protein BDQ12DRAFT_727290 [Crucibulum laeve]|uniref:Uncharacterized protein n=1 Tax=Crucibulum laeve TaxID=68775 RepID=A0A5C3LPR3_9AGAR|nr:hypothetical protein BDQ12DRAFT_727290 [Crucibulum laeve]